MADVACLGGLAAPFGSPEAPDLRGEFFWPGTDFGLDVTRRARVLYHHGRSRQVGRSKLAVADLYLGPDGLEAVALLDLADPVARALAGHAAQGRLYWSSGTNTRLMAKVPVGGARRIDAWPIVEVSLTLRPIDPRARVVVFHHDAWSAPTRPSRQHAGGG
jgi:hypothetical protein